MVDELSPFTPMASSVSRVEYPITLIFALFYIIRQVRVITEDLENTDKY